MLRLLLTFLLLFFSYNVSWAADCMTPSEAEATCKRPQQRVKSIAVTGGEGAQGGTCSICEDNPDHKEAREECKEAIEEYEEIVKKGSEFRNLCGKIPSFGKTRTAKNCLEASNNCQRCVGSDDDEAGCGDDDDDSESSDDGGVNGYNIINAIRGQQPGRGDGSRSDEAREAAKRYKQCPLYAQKELENVSEKRKEFKEQLDESTKQRDELVVDLKEVLGKLDDLETEQRELLPKHNKRLNDIAKTANKRLLNEVQQIGEQMIEVEFAIRTARTQYSEQKSAILTVCREKAEAALERYKTLRRQRIANGTLKPGSNGGFAGLAQLESLETRLEKYALSVEKRCVRSNKDVRDRLKRAKEFHDQNMDRLQIQREKLSSLLDTASKKLMKSAEDEDEQAEIDRAIEEFQANLKRIDKDIQEQLLAKERIEAQLRALEEAIAAANFEYSKYLEMESRAKKYGAKSGIDSDEIDVAEFMSAAQVYEDAIDKAYGVCGCSESTEAGVSSEDPHNKCDMIQKAMDTSFGDGSKGSGSKSKRQGADS